MYKCNDSKCVFYKGNESCILPANENFCHCVNGEVDSCINRIYDEQDLSRESREKLRRFKEEAE